MTVKTASRVQRIGYWFVLVNILWLGSCIKPIETCRFDDSLSVFDSCILGE